MKTQQHKIHWQKALEIRQKALEATPNDAIDFGTEKIDWHTAMLLQSVGLQVPEHLIDTSIYDNYQDDEEDMTDIESGNTVRITQINHVAIDQITREFLETLPGSSLSKKIEFIIKTIAYKSLQKI